MQLENYDINMDCCSSTYNPALIASSPMTFLWGSEYPFNQII